MIIPNSAGRYIIYLLFAVYFINGIIVIQSNTAVSDELDHISYGIRMLKGQPQKLNPYEDASTMPVAALNALPRGIEQLLKPGLQKNDYGVSDAILGRYITLLICALAGLFIYRWAKELSGEKGGVFALFLFVFCPNINAHSTLVGTDAYAMLCTLTSAYYFRKFVLGSRWKYLVLFSLTIGLGLIVKQSLFLLPLIYGFIACIVILHRRKPLQNLRLNLLRLMVMTAIVLLIINAGYLFNGTGRPLIGYQFKSVTFQQLQQWSWFNRIPLPLPAPFLEGFDVVKYMLSIGSGHGEVSPRSYLMGQYFTGNTLWYYYTVSLFFKTPLSVLLLFVGVLVAYLKKPFYKQPYFDIAFPLSLALFFVVFISLNNTSQHSIRHLLMIFPLLYVCMAQAVHWKIFRPVIMRVVLVVYSAGSFYFYFPNLLAYTNEMLWNKTKVYKTIASANIDMGQAGYSLQKHLQLHPETGIPGDEPAPGEYIFGINEYLDLKQTGRAAWLRKFEPYSHVNHCYLLFHITRQDLETNNLIR
jgi:hypothetical protein